MFNKPFLFNFQITLFSRVTVVTHNLVTQREVSLYTHLNACLTCLDLTKQVKLLFIQHKQKRLSPKKINRRTTVQLYFPLSWCFLLAGPSQDPIESKGVVYFLYFL